MTGCALKKRRTQPVKSIWHICCHTRNLTTANRKCLALANEGANKNILSKETSPFGV